MPCDGHLIPDIDLVEQDKFAWELLARARARANEMQQKIAAGKNPLTDGVTKDPQEKEVKKN